MSPNQKMTFIKLSEILQIRWQNLKNVDFRGKKHFSILHINYIGIDTILALESLKMEIITQNFKGMFI